MMQTETTEPAASSRTVLPSEIQNIRKAANAVLTSNAGKFLHGRMIQAAGIRIFTSRSLARGCYFILAVSWWALTLPPLIGNSGSVSINSDQSGIKWHEER
jgi:hypothetical protein